MSPPHGAMGSTGGLTPVASDAAAGHGSTGGGAQKIDQKLDLERLVRDEDALLGGLLQAAVHHTPHLLGTGAVKDSKTTGENPVHRV